MGDIDVPAPDVVLAVIDAFAGDIDTFVDDVDAFAATTASRSVAA